ncbi:PstS family phosphate ABC transporter substrate-binding protein [Gloeobacter kilaueensis]|uniref:ABC-type phosphate transport system, periplasmic component n=1 Tax=Gloeobacter kilaueensis (strain ATCC BAA-2537 / CCAP 1431/1 / ULC 316 / JS1) TaxID=1183438 RepID=U5QJP6_GLOK1|nr:substrate-binding domain-containing protein [Gloeobacter kilaueensis]AGY59217.1 ABC-type phosphate transport system, periplasmic component [Gloeobacter kilaueensis JS1]
MTSNLSRVACRNCGYEYNAPDQLRCEICNNPFKARPVPIADARSPITLGVSLAVALAVAGGGYWLWKQLSPAVDTGILPAGPIAAASLNRTPPNGVQIYPTMGDVPGVPEGLFTYGGSRPLAPLRSQVALAQFQKAYPKFRLRYTEPVSGSGDSNWGTEKVLSGELAFAQASMPVTDAQYARAQNHGFVLQQIPIAYDARVYFVHPALGIDSLSVEQARAIFRGTITNWKQVGGPDLAIRPFFPSYSGKSLKAQGAGTNMQPVRDFTAAIRKVATTPGGISQSTAALVAGQKSVRLLAIRTTSGERISPVGPDGKVNAAAVRDGTYPLALRQFVVIRRDGQLDEQAGLAYVNLLLCDEGQKLIQQAGLVPLRVF